MAINLVPKVTSDDMPEIYEDQFRGNTF